MNDRLRVSRLDSECIKLALDYGVLVPVDTWSLDQKEGDPTIVVACGGTHHAPDRLTHLWDRVTRRSHLILVNGGGHRLDGIFPANQRRNYVPYILDQIDEALVIVPGRLDVPVRALDVYFDFPCGVAQHHNVSAPRSFQTAIQVKYFLKERYPGLKVCLNFYLDTPADVIGPDHPLVLEHPRAPAFTFHFSSKATIDYLTIFEKEHAPLLTA